MTEELDSRHTRATDRPRPLASDPRVARILANVAALGALPLLASICAEYRVGREAVLLGKGHGDRGHPREAQARHHLWAVLTATLDLSCVELGRLVDKHHTTVLAGVRNHERRLARAYS